MLIDVKYNFLELDLYAKKMSVFFFFFLDFRPICYYLWIIKILAAYEMNILSIVSQKSLKFIHVNQKDF